MGKNNCLNCANAYGTTYCTRQMNMDVAKYKKCNGWTNKTSVLIKKKSAAAIPKEKKIRTSTMKIEDMTSDAQRFLIKGGHYSVRTGKFEIG